MKKLSPSLICMDLCNLEREIQRLESLGITLLHIDVIDGIYSPDMPLGIETVKQLRQRTNLEFDVHLMSVHNEPYVDLLLDVGVQRLCFQTEYEKRPTILLRKIRSKGVKAGIALAPETPLCAVKEILPLCDFVLIMRIDAGYAHLPGQNVYPSADQKVSELRKYATEQGLNIEIEIDGRVDKECMEKLSCANIFVSGSRGLFFKDRTWEENWEILKEVLQ